MIGDGICDDSCNIEFFNHDNEDCCLAKMVDIKCDECICFHTTQSQFLSTCIEPMMGDFKCQDACNTQEFNFDDFDCCFENINSEFCSDCICHLDYKRHKEIGHCYLGMIGDSYCNDECNNIPNRFDNGDCCLPTVQIHPMIGKNISGVF